MACAPPRAIISTVSRRISRLPSRRCWPEWSRHRRGWPRPATSPGRRNAAAWCSRKWPTPWSSPLPALAPRSPPSRSGNLPRFRPAPISPTGLRRSPRKRSRPILERSRSRPRSTPIFSGLRFGRSPTPKSAVPRRPWWRCGPMAGSSPWSAEKATRRARSTAPPRPAASRDRRSNCSSTWPRFAPVTAPTI